MNNQHKTNISTTSLSKKVPPACAEHSRSMGAEGAPLVSIIIPTYNRAHLIGETLDSVLAQTYQNWECIIVDDGSSDNTDEVVGAYVEKDSRFKFHDRPEDKLKGASSCRNYGLSKCSGKYVIFLDSDDWLMHYCLSQRVEFMLKNPSMKFMVVPMFIKGIDKKLNLKTIPFSDDYLKEFLSYRLHWGIMCTLWRKDLLIAIDGFNENYPRLNDPEIHIRAMLSFENSFYVATDYPADSIYRMEIQKEGMQFSLKYLNSLKLFFVDISKELKEKGKWSYKKYLKYYLNNYLRCSPQYLSFQDNKKLMLLSRKLKIIKLKEYILINIWIIINKANFKLSNGLTSKINRLIKRIIKMPK